MTITKNEVDKSIFLVAKDINNKTTKLIISPNNFQIGLTDSASNLKVTGKTTLSQGLTSNGTSFFNQGLSGSLTRLHNGISYLVAGNNITITSASNGQVLISSTASGTGDVIGPASSTTNAIAKFANTSGKLLSNTGITIDGSNNVTIPGRIIVTGGTTSNTDATLGNAAVGSFPYYDGGASSGVYAMFGHKDLDHSTVVTNYALYQDNLGNTVVNASDNRTLYFSVNNTSMGFITNNLIGTGIDAISLTGDATTKTNISLGNTTSDSRTIISAGTGGLILTGSIATDYTIGGQGATGNIQVGRSIDSQDIFIGLQGQNASGKEQRIFVGHRAPGGGNKRVWVEGDNVRIGNSGGDTDISSGPSAGTLTFATGSNTQIISVATGAGEKTVTLGSTNSTSSTTIQAGSGGVSIQAGNASAVGDIYIGTNDTYSTRTIIIGSDPDGAATRQQLVHIGSKNTSGYNRVFIADEDSYNGHEVNIISNNGSQTTSYSLINVGTVNATTNINVGTNTGASAVKRINIGSDVNDSYITLRAGTGCITMPDQPSFLVTLTSTQSNISTSTDVKVQFDSEIFDTENNFSTINYEFTAPVTGKYLFNIALRVDDPDIDADYYTLYLVTSNRSYRLSLFDPGQFNADPQYWWLNGSTVADMDSSDTAYVVIRQQAGAAQTDIIHGVANSFFSGWLLG